MRINSDWRASVLCGVLMALMFLGACGNPQSGRENDAPAPGSNAEEKVHTQAPADSGVTDMSQAGTPNPEPPIADPKWFECASDSDCKAVSGLCGGYGGVNHKYVDNYAAYASDMEDMYVCENDPADNIFNGPPPVKCQEHRCIVDIDKLKAQNSRQ